MGAFKLGLTLGAAMLLTAGTANAQKKYDTGATDTEIKIGNFFPYSGANAAFAGNAKGMTAYFKKINDEGGINGRKITYITYDDASDPAKALDLAKKLVETDGVLFITQPLGGPSNEAIRAYMNDRHVPQIFLANQASEFGDPQHFPWTMGWQPTTIAEGRIYGEYIQKNIPNAKIAVITSIATASATNPGADELVQGVKDVLGPASVVSTQVFVLTNDSLDAQMAALKASGANVLLDVAAPKGASLAIKKAADLGWKPAHFLINSSGGVPTVLKPAGLENATGILSTGYYKDPTDPAWKDDTVIKDWSAMMQKYEPMADLTYAGGVYGYMIAQSIVQVLRQAGDNLTRDNIMKQAASLKDFEPKGLLPGLKINTSATDFFPIEGLQMRKFNGTNWEFFGPIIDVGKH